MNATKKPKRKHFRYLTREEFNNPLYPLIELCCSEMSLTYYRDDVHQFVRATCCHNTNFRPADFSNVHFTYKRLSQQIELLYLLMYRYPEWEISSTSPFYQYKIQGFSKTIQDEEMKGEKTMRFGALSDTEFMDLHVFMNDFFRFKSLDKWRETMQDMISFVFEEESFTDYHGDACEVFKYLDKLGEALFLAYEIKGKAYMLEHHAHRFGIKHKKLVDAEAETAALGTR